MEIRILVISLYPMNEDRGKKTAIFPGSFDPFTRGHEAVVESALKLFDRVIIAIGVNISKSYLLSCDERKRLISEFYANQERVTVETYQGMTGDFARQVGAVAMVRGIRNSMDLELERTLEAVNREIYPEVQSVLLLTPASVAHISSSCVRELLSFGRNVDTLMPDTVNIEDYLER